MQPHNLVPMPPPGQGFEVPSHDLIPAGSDLEPLLPIVKSRLVDHPEHIARVAETLPESHKAKTLDAKSAQKRFRNYETLIQNWKDSVVPRFIAAGGLGISGIGLVGDLLFSGVAGHAPAMVITGLGLATGLWGFGWMLPLASQRGSNLRADAQLDKPTKQPTPATTPTIVPNIKLPNDSDQQAKIDAALNIQLPDVDVINATLPAWAKLVYIAGAVIKMGNDGSVRSDEKPAFTAVVSPFHVMEAAVSNAAYREFESSHNSDMKSKGFNDDDQPAVEVTWDEAQAFVAWMNRTHPVKGMKWRLQREAEKDLIMRDGDLNTIIDVPSHDLVNWGRMNQTLKVKDPKYRGKMGVYHGRGNILEWCEDPCGRYPSGVVINYRGVENSNIYVLRGASWLSNIDKVRAACRFYLSAIRRRNYVGFRLVLAHEDS